ncbi:MAG: DUF2161 family putative PD-(D/E)XK-type phosphodiesterase [Pseudomonadota bacterium]
MAKTVIRETELYEPVKALLEGQGYVVKGEVGAADIVAVRDGDDPVIVELKTGFSLALYHQGIARQKLSDDVYLAVPRGKGRQFKASLKNNKVLCRRLGLGLITVRLRDGYTEVHLDPAPYVPRQSKRRKGRLLREFSRLVGDPNTGGQVRVGIVTAYRHDALRCVGALRHGPLKASAVAEASGVEVARRVMSDNHYGWFERVERGIYALSPKGEAAVEEYAAVLAEIGA